eukprot:scaffold1809_cov386-Prasinococcus_capsulatus_cf.AAC.23
MPTDEERRSSTGRRSPSSSSSSSGCSRRQRQHDVVGQVATVGGPRPGASSPWALVAQLEGARAHAERRGPSPVGPLPAPIVGTSARAGLRSRGTSPVRAAPPPVWLMGSRG